MKILLAEGTGHGFLAHYSHALALGFTASDHHVRLITRKEGELNGLDFPIDRRSCLDAGSGAWRQLRAEVRAFNPDCVHLQWVGHPLAALRFVMFCQRRGIVVLYTPHNLLPHRYRWLLQPLYRLLYQRVDAVVARDGHIAWGLQEILGIPHERSNVIEGSPNLLSHPLMPRKKVAELAEHSRDERQLLLFGYGGRKKGAEAACRALLRRKSLSGLHLVLAGHGLQRSIPPALYTELCQRMRVSSIDRYLAAGEVAWLFEQSDLLLMPYQKQCDSPLVDLALALGTPVLRSDLVNHPSFVEREDGCTYATTEPLALDSALTWLLNDEHIDPLKQRLRLRSGSQLPLRQLVEAHTNLYARLIQPSSRHCTVAPVLKPSSL
tara:strand:+ start:4655 stop:5791 length:1137 start_codon:yes stop_codon:yes gene_type:complete